MGVGIEDIIAVKALETGLVPAVPNFRDVDPDLGALNLSKGGAYRSATRCGSAAGFGSQITMTLLRWVPGRRRPAAAPDELGYAYRVADPDAWTAWLSRVSGKAEPRLEVVQRRLRVADGDAPAPKPAPVPVAVEPAAAPVAAASCRGAGRVAPPGAGRPRRPGARAAPATASPARATARGRVLAIVAEQTGYPRGSVGPGAGSGGGSGDRHGQAGGVVRDDPGGATGSSATTTSSCATTRR